MYEKKKSDSIVTPSCKLKANRPAECSMLSFHIREHGSSSEVRMQSHNSNIIVNLTVSRLNSLSVCNRLKMQYCHDA